MKNIWIILIVFLFFLNPIYGQQFEYGFNIGYSFDNIVDIEITEGKAVIGKRLWKPNYGINAIYYFNKPTEQDAFAIGFKYHNYKRGSISEKYSDSRFEIYSNSIGFFGRYAHNLIPNAIASYIDVGIGYVFLDDNKYFYGNHTQIEAFDKLDENLMIKNNVVTFIYAIGLEGEIIKDKLKLFIEINGDAGISKLNENSGKFGTQPFGFGIGLKYIMEKKRSSE